MQNNMKKIIINFVVLLLINFQFSIFNSYSQSPKMFKYQTVVRNSTGNIIPNQAVAFKISLLQGNTTGTAVYSEAQSKTTNDFGLVNLEIGNGIIISGSMNTINWANGPYFVKVELDINNGTSFITMGTSELLSVPYALYAEKVGNNGFTETDPVFGTSAAHAITNSNINNWNTAFGWGNHAGLYRPIGYVPAWSEITGKPSFASVATSGSYNDLINKPIAGNGIQINTSNVISTNLSLSVSNSGDTLRINPGNYVIVPNISSVNATNPILSNATVTNITSSSANLGYTIFLYGAPAITARGVCWDTIINPTIAGYHTTETGGTGTFTSNITGLLYNKIYYARAYATNSNGTYYSSEKTFSTLATTATLTTADTSAVTQTTAVCGGNISSNGGAGITERGVCWNTSQSPTISNYHTSNGSGSGSYTSNLTGLTPNTTYYYRAYATNNAGTSYGDQKSLTTSYILPTVTIDTVENINQNSAGIWSFVTSAGTSTLTERGVCWSIYPNPTIYNWKYYSSYVGIGGFATTITMLIPNTTYYIRSYVISNYGTTYSNETKVFTTSSAYFESFENGYPTTWSGIGWGVTNTTDYHGNNCLLANQVGDSVQFTRTITTSPNGNISFYYKCNTYPMDYVTTAFYIDNVLQATFNEGSWTLHSYSLSTGTHTFKWKVINNHYNPGAFIDYIIVSP